MKAIATALALALTLTLPAAPEARAQTIAASLAVPGGDEISLGIGKAWAKQTARGEVIVYVDIDNPTDGPLLLTSVTSPLAREVAIVTTRRVGTREMSMVVPAVPIAPEARIEMGPDGTGIRLRRLRETVEVDSEIPVTLHFGNGTLDVVARVR